jgi:hypothetical protein
MEIKYIEYSEETKGFITKSTENNILYKHLYDLKEKYWGLNVAMFLELDGYGMHQAIKDPEKNCYYLYYNTCGWLRAERLRSRKGQDEIDYLDNLFEKNPFDETAVDRFYKISVIDLFEDTSHNFHPFCETLKTHGINHLYLEALGILQK